MGFEDLENAVMKVTIFSSPEQHSRRAIVLPLVLASTNVKVFVKVFKTSLFPIIITTLIHFWHDYTYWPKILHSTIPTTLGHVKAKVTDLEFSCKNFTSKFLGPHFLLLD